MRQVQTFCLQVKEHKVIPIALRPCCDVKVIHSLKGRVFKMVGSPAQSSHYTVRIFLVFGLGLSRRTTKQSEKARVSARG